MSRAVKNRKPQPQPSSRRTPAAAKVHTRRPRKLELLELLEALARATNEAVSPEAAMRVCLERISAYARWSLGRVAILKAGSPAPVVQVSLWHGRDTERYAEFMRVSESHDYTQLSGMYISVVLREQRAVWIADFGRIGPRGRLQAAVDAGLHSGFAFPIIVQGKVAAFIEFFAREPRRVDPRLFGAIGSVGAQLARLIERDRAEAAQARLAAIVESSNDAIISRDLERKILTWNAAAERLLGYRANEVIGRDVSLIIPPDQEAQAEHHRALLAAGHPVPTFDTVRIAKDGRRIEVSITQFPIKGTDGATVGVSSIFRDISELKRAQRDLERKARLSQLMESLARAANEAASAEAAMPTCLALISEYCNWTLGRVATFAPGQRLGAPQSSVWHCPQPERFAEFIEISSHYSYSGRPTGQFVSEALREGRPVWVPDLSATPGFGRLTAAAKCGLRAGFAFPVIVAGESLAFLEFFATEVREPDAPFLDAISSISAQLARLIERGRAEKVHARLAAIVENSDDAIASRDLERRIVTWNAAAERLFGYSAAEIIGQSVSLIIPPDQAAVAAQTREVLASGQPVPATDAVRLTKDGRRIDVSITQSPIKDAGGRVIGVSLIFRDITERKQAEEKIRQLAHYDNLTGLPNRALFYDRLGQAIGRGRRERHELALLFLDLDDFKAVNDTLGHDAGDELLKAVTERVRQLLRESDTAARIGGDEFTVILPVIRSREDAARVAGKIIEALSAPYGLSGRAREARVGVSIGIAIHPADAPDADALLKAADTAMYQAKQKGNNFRFYKVAPDA